MSFIRHGRNDELRAGDPHPPACGRDLRTALTGGSTRRLRRGRRRAMRAYVGHVGYAGLRRFVAEDVLPADVLEDLIGEWTSATATVVLAVLDEDAAGEIGQELTVCR